MRNLIDVIHGRTLPETLKKFSALLLLLILSALSTGCSTMGTNARMEPTAQKAALDDFDEFDSTVSRKTFDPLLPYNRAMFFFNDKTYYWVLNPVAKSYAKVTPVKVRRSFGRAFRNAAGPVRIVNSAFQGRWKKSGVELGRMLVNTTWGVAGLFDPAGSRLDWKAPTPEDFGQTLGHYGVGSGFPIVLPFFGPSNLRDALGQIPDSWLRPRVYLLNGYENMAYRAAQEVNRVSLAPDVYEGLTEDALDPYTLLRDAYEQNRNNLIDERSEEEKKIEKTTTDIEVVAAMVDISLQEFLAVLRDNSLPSKQKRESVITAVHTISDLELLGKLALGREHWSSITPEQRQEYSQLFVEISSYFIYDQLARFGGEQVRAGELVELEMPGKPKYEASIFISSGNFKAKLDLLLAERSDGWRAYDLEVMGISARKSFGSQYAHFLRNKEFDRLLEKMRNQVAESRAKYAARDQ